jgi:hypothetical protein
VTDDCRERRHILVVVLAEQWPWFRLVGITWEFVDKKKKETPAERRGLLGIGSAVNSRLVGSAWRNTDSVDARIGR